jgi:hypothetical protein
MTGAWMTKRPDAAPGETDAGQRCGGRCSARRDDVMYVARALWGAARGVGSVGGVGAFGVEDATRPLTSDGLEKTGRTQFAR